MRFSNLLLVIAFLGTTTAAANTVKNDDANDHNALVAITDDGQSILERCDLDGLFLHLYDAVTALSVYYGTGDGDSSGPTNSINKDSLGTVMNGFAYIQQLSQRTCSNNEPLLFTNSLGDFHKCAGFDLVSFIEELPSAVVGAELECMLSYFKENDVLAMSAGGMASTTTKLSESCARELLGSNSFGDMVRTMYLHPDKTLPCFTRLAMDIPSCIYNIEGPMPLVGPWLKSASCVLGESSKLLEDICEAELQGFDSCLHSFGEGKTNCDQTIKHCAMETATMKFPKPLLGAPLPDSCSRVAKERGLEDTLAQYHNFKSICLPDEWGGWLAPYASDSSILVGEINSNARVGSSFAGTTSPPTGAGAGALTGSFVGGIIIGIILSAVFFNWPNGAYRRERRRERRSNRRAAPHVSSDVPEISFTDYPDNKDINNNNHRSVPHVLTDFSDTEEVFMDSICSDNELEDVYIS